jgi:hypothetical protein
VLLQQKRAPTTETLIGLDIRPQADIQGDLKFVLTPALIKSIFEQNPIIKRAYQEKVPSAIDEKTFWMQYFTSRFFKEGLSSSAGALSAKTSPTGNILDEYYVESQREAEGGLALNPIDTIPISIDIMATAEDHHQAADLDAVAPESASKTDRAKLVTIRKLNKLSASVVEASGAARVECNEEALAELLVARDGDSAFVGLELKETAMDQKRDVIVDEVHWNRLRAEWDDSTAQPFRLVSYHEYAALMQRHRPVPSAEEQRFTPDKLTVVAPAAFQTFISNTLELLRQFWSAYPPGTSTERHDKAVRMASILEQMLQSADHWLAACPSAEERTFLADALTHLRRSAELAIGSARQLGAAAASKMAAKRAKVG